MLGFTEYLFKKFNFVSSKGGGFGNFSGGGDNLTIGTAWGVRRMGGRDGIRNHITFQKK